jgi:hypothetical protein
MACLVLIDRSSKQRTRVCGCELEDESQLRTRDAVAGLPGGAVGTNVSFAIVQLPPSAQISFKLFSI